LSPNQKIKDKREIREVWRGGKGKRLEKRKGVKIKE
jgi:hypothetical protein